MGKITLPWPVKLIMPMLSAQVELFEHAEQTLVQTFGPVDYRSPRMPFTHTTYYAPEFGDPLSRQFIAFERLIMPERLAEIKVFTNALEQSWRQGTHRRINLDPGYLSQAKLVLATTKDHGHRIYIGQGIYAEVTLTYRDKDFRPWPWTYPDYASDPYRAVLRAIRTIYMEQLKTLRETGRVIPQ